MKKLGACSIILLLFAVTALPESNSVTFATSDRRVSLVELFTSEGCSSCPPAELWMSKLKNSPNLWTKIVPVAFHVDYWDHLGWRDRFAKTEFTERQRQYASAWGGDSVYTPGFVVNGKEWRGWFGNPAVPEIDGKAGILQVVVTNAAEVQAIFKPEGAPPPNLQLNVAALGGNLGSDVKAGENRGRTLRHDFVVLSLTNVPLTVDGDQWKGSAAIGKADGPDKPLALAAWINSGHEIIQATGGWLKNEH